MKRFIYVECCPVVRLTSFAPYATYAPQLTQHKGEPMCRERISGCDEEQDFIIWL